MPPVLPGSVLGRLAIPGRVVGVVGRPMLGRLVPGWVEGREVIDGRLVDGRLKLGLLPDPMLGRVVGRDDPIDGRVEVPMDGRVDVPPMDGRLDEPIDGRAAPKLGRLVFGRTLGRLPTAEVLGREIEGRLALGSETLGRVEGLIPPAREPNPPPELTPRLPTEPTLRLPTERDTPPPPPPTRPESPPPPPEPPSSPANRPGVGGT